jgi:hypothetical protein
LLSAVTVPTWAFSLWDRPTDDFVCDFSPWTAFRLQQRNKTNIPYILPDREKVEAYTRLALREASSNCKDGQMLMLHSNDGSDLDAKVFRAVTSHLCLVADVAQKAVPTKEEPNAFEVRCRVSKMTQAKESSAKSEAEKPTEAFILESYQRARSAPASGSSGGQTDRKDTKLCVGQVIGFGGGCK